MVCANAIIFFTNLQWKSFVAFSDTSCSNYTDKANRVSTKFPYTSVTSELRASRFVHWVISGLFMMNFLHWWGFIASRFQSRKYFLAQNRGGLLNSMKYYSMNLHLYCDKYYCVLFCKNYDSTKIWFDYYVLSLFLTKKRNVNFYKL